MVDFEVEVDGASLGSRAARRLKLKNPHPMEVKEGSQRYMKTSDSVSDATQALGAIVMLSSETWLFTVKSDCIARGAALIWADRGRPTISRPADGWPDARSAVAQSRQQP